MKQNSLISFNELNDFVDLLYPYLGPNKIITKIEKGPVLFVGDIHGYFQNFLDALKLGELLSISTLVFLGDYIDRGPEQLNTLLSVLYLFARSNGLNERPNYIDREIKDSYPFSVVALKGNHEDWELNKQYGFLNELKEMNMHPKSIQEEIEELYSYLPLIAETSWGTLGIHGGIPYVNDLDRSANFLNIIKRYINGEEPEDLGLTAMELNLGVFQMLWNDPFDKDERNSPEPIYEKSIRGPIMYNFNKSALSKFLKASNCRRIVRSHEAIRGAYEVMWDATLIHIFSAYPYYGKIKTPSFYYENENGEGKIINDKGEVLQLVPPFK